MLAKHKFVWGLKLFCCTFKAHPPKCVTWSRLKTQGDNGGLCGKRGQEEVCCLSLKTFKCDCWRSQVICRCGAFNCEVRPLGGETWIKTLTLTLTLACLMVALRLLKEINHLRWSDLTTFDPYLFLQGGEFEQTFFPKFKCPTSVPSLLSPPSTFQRA